MHPQPIQEEGQGRDCGEQWQMAQWKWDCEEMGRDSYLANKGVASKDGHPPVPVGDSLGKKPQLALANKTTEHSFFGMHAHTHTQTHTQTIFAIQEDECSDQDLGGQLSMHYGVGLKPLASFQPP